VHSADYCFLSLLTKEPSRPSYYHNTRLPPVATGSAPICPVQSSNSANAFTNLNVYVKHFRQRSFVKTYTLYPGAGHCPQSHIHTIAASDIHPQLRSGRRKAMPVLQNLPLLVLLFFASFAQSAPRPQGAVPVTNSWTQSSSSSYWLASILRQGSVAYGSGSSTYPVYRNVKDYGAQGQHLLNSPRCWEHD